MNQSKTIPPFTDYWRKGNFPGLRQWLQARPDSALFSGLAGSSDALLIADVHAVTASTILVLTDTMRRAEMLVDECKTLCGEAAVSLFPSRDPVPYNMKSPFGPTIESRFRVLGALLSGNSGIYVAPASALLQRVPRPRDLFNRIIRLAAGDTVALETLRGWLTDAGFRQEHVVEDLGTFSVRGGIVDIYPFMSEGPIRLEYWGDTIDSIREFDVFTQRSKKEITRIEIFPMRELAPDEESIDRGIKAMREYAVSTGIASSTVGRLEHQWKSAGDHEGIEWFSHWFDPPTASLLDYFPPATIVVWNDLLSPIRRCEEGIHNYTRHLERVPEQILALVSPPEKLLFNPHRVTEDLKLFTRIYIDTRDEEDVGHRESVSMGEQPSFAQGIDSVIQDLTTHHRQGYETVVVCPNLGSGERLQELISESCPFARFAVGFFRAGFIDKENRQLVYTENQLFNRSRTPLRARRVKSGVPIAGFDSLSPGDYVVHVDHGIGRFVGINRVPVQGGSRDCMVVHFQERARLFVPIEDFHKVQKYMAREQVTPTLSKLGSAAWERLKQRTRESLKEMAQELIDLYAKRQHIEGIRFSSDTLWQKEFEDAFMFEETPDQLRAIVDVKKDMESSRPRDRLICGDVGFGKTEVAMRAAFKAVMDGFQVCVLAPTTILAAQHFAVMTERMADFPVRIRVVSRFLKPSEQRKVIEMARNGEVDVVIGTHRLLSKDVGFKNLGLLIIDEEQKFGVKHKERLKQYRSSIDVLSMTATPIPRTLHMSLIGARDLSTINTPPRNRLPVETVVSEYHDELIRNAVGHELDRGGQVYVVHNRIKNLDLLKDRIEQLVPRARVISAHGQMEETELEAIMKEFVAGRYDVLVSTVIIENGLDITNVNTIVVNRADTMGLSQLYQLRGRVGRSTEQAYAYLLTPPFKQVDEQSLRRLRALEQYTELGSGFQIAMRDLELRGAGDILGTRQHGFIAAVGFEMYCRLLEEAVREIKGEPVTEQQQEVTVELPVEAYLPPEFISDGATRVTVYQQLSAVTDICGVEEMERELGDRFGPIPPPVQSLMLLVRVKVYGRVLGCSQVRVTPEGVLQLSFEGSAEQVQSRTRTLLAGTQTEFAVEYGTPLVLKTRLQSPSPAQRVQEAESVLAELSGQGAAHAA